MKLTRIIFLLAVVVLLVPVLAACGADPGTQVTGAPGSTAPGAGMPIATATATSTQTPTPTSTAAGSAPAPVPGRVAPAISLSSLQGGTVTLAGLKGHPVLVNFFATWCGPCRSEMDYLESVYKNTDYQKAGFELLEVNIQESGATVQKFLNDNKLTMPVLLDTEAIAAEAYNVNGIPASFFIDRNGIIQKVKIGAYPSLDALTRDVQALIGSQ